MNTSNNNIYVQITAGRGPAECAWVVAQLLKVLLSELRGHGFKCAVMARNKGHEPNTLNSCLLLVMGNDAAKVLKCWEGTVQWIGRSPFRKYHKRKNWFIGLSVFDDVPKGNFNERDLEFSTFKSSGPGGQHRNKVETAVRVIHRPSGLMVTAADSKSQIQNRKSAVEKLRRAFEQQGLEQLQERFEEHWKEHLAVQRGNPVKVFEGSGFNPK